MLLSGAAGIYAWNGLPKATRSLVFQCFAGILITITARYWRPNGWLHNLYMLLDFGLVLWAATAFLPHRISRWYIPAAYILYLAAWFASLLNSGATSFEMQPFAIWAFLTGCILITILYLVVLFHVTLSGIIVRQKSTFFLCFAILLYYACSTPLYGMLNYLIQYYPHTAQLLHQNINWGLSNTRYLFIGIYFLSFAWKHSNRPPA